MSFILRVIAHNKFDGITCDRFIVFFNCYIYIFGIISPLNTAFFIIAISL